jgi:hypothetical protein
MLSLDATGASTDRTVIFSEDFEHAWPGTLPNGWDRWDRNNGSDVDYWCRSMYENVSPTHAAWCAQIGYNSLFQNALNKNITRLDDPNVTYQPKDYTLLYDTNMDGFMRRPLLGIDSFSSVTVTFRYWALTGNSTTSLGDDYVWVSVTSSADDLPNSGDRTEVWRQPSSNSSGWRTVTVPIPTDSTWLCFNFRSGPIVPEGGPYIGVFIDDIVVEGTDDQAPTSTVGQLPAAIDQTSFDVPVVMLERGSGMEYIELYYRINGSGLFSLYTDASVPTGRWPASPIPFMAPRDGSYELFTRAADIWGNVEGMKTSADAVIIVDRVQPSSIATVTGTWGAHDWYVSPVKIALTGWDDASGVDRYTYRLDGGLWSDYPGQLTVSMDGRHVLEYFATDAAGNAEAIRSSIFQIDLTGPTVVLGAPDGKVFSSGNLVLTFEASDPASGIGMADYSVDGSGFKALSHNGHSITITGLEDGAHRLVLRVWDNAGNPTEIALNMTVDPSAASIDLAATAAPLVVTGLTVAGLVGVILYSRRRT